MSTSRYPREAVQAAVDFTLNPQINCIVLLSIKAFLLFSVLQLVTLDCYFLTFKMDYLEFILFPAFITSFAFIIFMNTKISQTSSDPTFSYQYSADTRY